MTENKNWRDDLRVVRFLRGEAPLRADKAALARGKNGRRQSIALQGFREALPRRVGCGGTTSVSSDFCEAQPRPIPAYTPALARGENGRRRSIALQIFAK